MDVGEVQAGHATMGLIATKKFWPTDWHVRSRKQPLIHTVYSEDEELLTSTESIGEEHRE